MKTAIGFTWIHNAQLVDGTGSAAVPDAAVVIRDGHIAYSGPCATAPEVPPEAHRIDARGGTLMPGLIEAHIHLTCSDVAELADLDIKYPAEYVTLQAVSSRPANWPEATRLHSANHCSL